MSIFHFYYNGFAIFNLYNDCRNYFDYIKTTNKVYNSPGCSYKIIVALSID